jgi:DNA polymerase III subunit chi
MTNPIVLFIELKIASKDKYVCEITEKLFQNNMSTVIFCSENARQLDNLLWTWKQESFIPHCISNEAGSVNGQVLICTSDESLPGAEALILHDPLPIETLKNYKLIIDFAEIYHSDKKLESRRRFKELRDSNAFDIHFTQLGALLAKKSIKLGSLI